MGAGQWAYPLDNLMKMHQNRFETDSGDNRTNHVERELLADETIWAGGIEPVVQAG